jgi:hypothetical protein
MADKKVSQLDTLNTASGDDLLLVVNDPAGTPASRKISVNNLFGNVVVETTHKHRTTFQANTLMYGTVMNVTANAIFQGNLRMTSDTPASNNAASEGYGVGSIWFDSDYIYVATATGTIKRAALSEFS